MPAPLYCPMDRPHRRPWSNSAGASVTAPNGGLPLPPVLIPYSWIATPLTRKPTVAITKAQITQANGATAYASASAALVRQYGANAAQTTLDTACDADPQNLAAFLTTYESEPRPRQPTLTLNLLARTDAECVTILGVKLGQRVRITQAPAGTPPGALSFVVEGISHVLAVEQRTVTWATAAPVGSSALIADTFGRRLPDSWGNTNTGQPWLPSDGSATDYQVANGFGTQQYGLVNAFRHTQVDTGVSNQTVTVDVTVPVVPTGAAITPRVVARASDFSNLYEAALIVGVGGATTLQLFSVVGGSASGISGGTAVGTHAAGDTWRVKLDVSGPSIRAKAWKPVAGLEPDWQQTAADTSLTAGTRVGVRARLESGNTNTVPVLISFANFESRTGINPQGAVGPWFRLGSSSTGGSDLVPF